MSNGNSVKEWILPMILAVVGVLLLGIAGIQVETFGDVLIYVATWITMLHVFVGEYVLLRYLHATSRNQRILDILAFILFCGCILCVRNPALWCAFLAGVMALAIMKYVLVKEKTSDAVLRRYAMEKIRWEAPSVILFAVLAILLSRMPEAGMTVRLLEIGILAAVAGFAVWMIWIRHIYRWVRRARG